MRNLQRAARGAALVVTLAACGASGSDSSSTSTVVSTASTTTAVDAAPALLEMCADLPKLQTEVVGSAPGAAGPDDAFAQALRAYAEQQSSTFAGMWFARESGGTMVLTFTDDPEAHRAAIADFQIRFDDIPEEEREFEGGESAPDVTHEGAVGSWGQPYDVLQVKYAETDFEPLRAAILPLVEGGALPLEGWGIDVWRNRLSLSALHGRISHDELVTMSDALLPLSPADMMCVNGELLRETPAAVDPGMTLEVITEPIADGRYPAETKVVCGHLTFEIGAMQPLQRLADLGEFEMADAVSKFLSEVFLTDGPPPAGDWARLSHDGATAVAIGWSDRGLWFVRMEMGPVGWFATEGGGTDEQCEVRHVLPDGLGIVEWELDPSFPAPDAESTEIHLVVREVACAGGRDLGNHLLDPQITESKDDVRVVFATIAAVGERGCQENPPTPVTITLDAPLGTRSLRDGMTIGAFADLAFWAD